MNAELREGKFQDRRDAGRRLALRLESYRRGSSVVVLGLLRGGVAVAAEIARSLELPLDVLICRKIGAPENPEFAIGAIAEGGEIYLNEESLELAGASPAYLASAIARQREEILRRQKFFRGGRPLTLPPRSTVLVADDGVATGATMIAAIRSLRRLDVRRIVLAIPVAPAETADLLGSLADELAVLRTPAVFWAVGVFYDDFTQVSDEEVREILVGMAMEKRGLPL